MGQGLLWGSTKLLLLPGRAVDHGAAVQPASVCAPPATGLGARGGSCSLKDWKPPACQTYELQPHKLSVEGKGPEQCARRCGTRPWGCVLTLRSAPEPQGLGAQDGRKGPNSVTFIQSVILFLLPVSGDHQGLSAG